MESNRTASLNWLRQEIDRFALDMYPVQNILQISFDPTIEQSPQIRDRVLREVREKLRFVKIGHVDLSFVSCPHSPLYYYTTSTYNDMIQARTLKQFFAQFNKERADRGELTYLFSRPLDYLANAQDFFERAENQAKEISELSRSCQDEDQQQMSTDKKVRARESDQQEIPQRRKIAQEDNSFQD